MYVAVFPCQVLIGTVSMIFQVVIAAVNGSKHLLDYRSLDVLGIHQITHQLLIVLPGTHRSSHTSTDSWRNSNALCSNNRQNCFITSEKVCTHEEFYIKDTSIF